jgi:hypothetical protein
VRAENRECTLSYVRETVDGTDIYTVIFATPSDKEEWWMGLDDVINGAKRDMQFGLKLHELMTINAREVGRDVPSILVKWQVFSSVTRFSNTRTVLMNSVCLPLR